MRAKLTESVRLLKEMKQEKDSVDEDRKRQLRELQRVREELERREKEVERVRLEKEALAKAEAEAR